MKIEIETQTTDAGAADTEPAADYCEGILVCHNINTDIERAFCLLQDIIFWLSF